MATPGSNAGVHVLDDFVCEAIHDPAIPVAKPNSQGTNEGMSVVAELVFDASNRDKSAGTPGSSPPQAVAGDDVAQH
jgi:hypothetical protein